MRIVKFTAENIKRLKAVEIVPDGTVVEITGPNGSGKTSILDAIYYALAGVGVIPSKVVRDGEEKAFVKLDLGEIIVTRKFQQNGNTSLVVEAQSGARFPSPQKMLDDLVGSLSFDPLEFTRLKSDQQFERLHQLVKVRVRTDDGKELELQHVDGRIDSIASQRRDVNREVKAFEARLVGLGDLPKDTPTEPVNIDKLTESLDEVGKYNAELEKRRAFLQSEKSRIDGAFQIAKNKREHAKITLQSTEDVREEVGREIESLERRANQLRLDCETRVEKLKYEAALLEKQAQAIEDEAIRESQELDVSAEEDEPQDTYVLRQRITQAQATNKFVERHEQAIKIGQEMAEKIAVAARLTDSIEQLEQAKQQALESAEMPVMGLGFGASEVTYLGRPLTNASSAEQLRVSVAIAMAMNPKLRVLRVKDGSLLDEASLKSLTALCEAGDYQLWIERVELSDTRPTIVMEDGFVQGSQVAAP